MSILLKLNYYPINFILKFIHLLPNRSLIIHFSLYFIFLINLYFIKQILLFFFNLKFHHLLFLINLKDYSNLNYNLCILNFNYTHIYKFIYLLFILINIILFYQVIQDLLLINQTLILIFINLLYFPMFKYGNILFV